MHGRFIPAFVLHCNATILWWCAVLNWTEVGTLTFLATSPTTTSRCVSHRSFSKCPIHQAELNNLHLLGRLFGFCSAFIKSGWLGNGGRPRTLPLTVFISLSIVLECVVSILFIHRHNKLSNSYSKRLPCPLLLVAQYAASQSVLVYCFFLLFNEGIMKFNM